MLSLFRPTQGSKILDEEITDRDGSLVPWSLGAYLSRARKGAEKIAFGVGRICSQQSGVASTSFHQSEVAQSQTQPSTSIQHGKQIIYCVYYNGQPFNQVKRKSLLDVMQLLSSHLRN